MFANREWTNIHPIVEGKDYKLTFIPRELSSVGIHIHDEKGKHLYGCGIAGGAQLPRVKYQYVINARVDGYLSMRVMAGSIDELTVEQIVEVNTETEDIGDEVQLQYN